MSLNQRLHQAIPTQQQQSFNRQLKAVRAALRANGCELQQRGQCSWYVVGAIATGLTFKPSHSYWQSASKSVQQIAQQAAKEALCR